MFESKASTIASSCVSPRAARFPLPGMLPALAGASLRPAGFAQGGRSAARTGWELWGGWEGGVGVGRGGWRAVPHGSGEFSISGCLFLQVAKNDPEGFASRLHYGLRYPEEIRVGTQASVGRLLVEGDVAKPGLSGGRASK